jgi:signal transduction histidine kinase/CheY-like chemotaxis protein
MASPPPSGSGDGRGRLDRCIRDLAALNALPSMCVGRSPEETLEIVADALPTALGCDLVYLELPGSPRRERLSLSRVQLEGARFAEVRAAIAAAGEQTDPLELPGIGSVWCLQAELPVGAERGLLLAGRTSPLDPETDRVLVRSAANLVGTTLETAKVLESARRKDEFLAMLGHELRNPLAPILTAVELLGRHPIAAREKQVIERHTRHLARLVDDLLDISRVTRGEVELRNQRVSLHSVLERAVEIAAPLVARHRHTLRMIGAGEVTIEGDPVRLAQVFGNLLTNAAKFTPPDGTIEVLVDELPGRVRTTVRDNGRGLGRDELERIFEPFVQVDRERDALGGGLGLGLAIVSNLVRRHGGTIVAQSEGRGQGASFSVELPTAAPAPQPVQGAPPQTAGVRAGVRVLVVDDNIDVAELLSEALQMEGFQTAVEYDSRAALEKWRSFRPHAAILDVGLPQVDGYELARTVRARHGREPLLIAATGYGRDADRSRAAAAGFDCHFVKPVSIEDLVDTLDRRVVPPGGPA